MAISALNAPRLMIGTFNLAANATQIDFSQDVEQKDATTFAYLAGGFRSFVPGLRVMVYQVSGFNDYATGTGWDEYARGILGAQQVVTMAPSGDGTAGNQAVITRAIVDTLPSFDAQVGEVPKIAVKLWGSGSVSAYGQITQPSATAITATGNTSPVNIGAVGASQSVYAAVHVTTVSGTTPSATFQLQSSTASGGAYTNRGIAGAAITAVGAQWLSATGPVTDTWWRLGVTVAGTSPSFTVTAAIGIF